MTDSMINIYKKHFVDNVSDEEKTLVTTLLRNLEYYDRSKFIGYLTLLYNVKDTKFTTEYKDVLADPSFVEKLRADLYDLYDMYDVEPVSDTTIFGVLDKLSKISPAETGFANMNGGKRRRGKRSTKRNRTKSRKSRNRRNRH